MINVLRCAVAIIVAKQSELALTARAHTHTHTGVKLGAQTHTGVSTELKTDQKNRIGDQEMKNKKEQLAFSYYLRREQQMQYCDRSASVSSSSRAVSHQVTPELFRHIQVKDKDV